MMPKLRLDFKDGRGKVFNVETGEELRNVTGVRFVFEDGIGRLDVTQSDWNPELSIENKGTTASFKLSG